MPTRDGQEIVVKYVLFDLTHPRINEAADDIRSVLRKVGDRLVLSLNRKHDNTRAVVKAAYLPEDADRAAEWFRSRPWKDAVLQVTGWDNRDAVRDFVRRSEWTGEEQ